MFRKKGGEMTTRECRKRVVVLAQQLLAETNEDYTPTDRWSEDDWYMFQYASWTDAQTQALASMTDRGKIRKHFHSVLVDGDNSPFNMTDAARRIISDSERKAGIFEPILLAILRNLTGTPHPHSEWRSLPPGNWLREERR